MAPSISRHISVHYKLLSVSMIFYGVAQQCNLVGFVLVWLPNSLLKSLKIIKS